MELIFMSALMDDSIHVEIEVINVRSVPFFDVMAH